MPKIAYEPWTPPPATAAHITAAIEITSRYAAQGYDLSLRQLYYQFVKDNLFANNFRNYKNLGTWVDKARHAGLIDWNHLTDRDRSPGGGDAGWASPEEAIQGLAEQYNITHWADQDKRVEVWVEKLALVDVVSRPADRWDVTYFACKGYVSASAMWRAAMRLRRYIENGQDVTILHLGDHDPSGLDMTRDIADRLTLFLRHHLGGYFKLGNRFAVERIALNPDQIEQYQPPPQPAKESDARFRRYQEETGLNESWELDALDPPVLEALIEEKILEHLDLDLRQERLDQEERERSQLTEISERFEDIVGYLDAT